MMCIRKQEGAQSPIAARATSGGGPGNSSSVKDKAPLQVHHRIFLVSGGRLGNRLYSFAATYGLCSNEPPKTCDVTRLHRET